MAFRLAGTRLRNLRRPVVGGNAQPYAWAAAAVSTLVIAAIANHLVTKNTLRRNPPAGKFVQVRGVRLHYLEIGEGEPVVFLHGNGSMIQDFEVSGLVAMASKRHRVIVFDRPGYGYSKRPRSTLWTPEAQAKLIHSALRRIGIVRATIVGHSWGTSVAIALALNYSRAVGSLVLASGYYYPTARLDVVALCGPALPIVGDIISHTLAPLMGWLTWPLAMRKIFSPNPVPSKFKAFPKAMALRPSQIRTSAVEAALMIPYAFALCNDYGNLKMPVVIIAGRDDQLIDVEQSTRLHRDIPQSRLHLVARAGHMIHQTETRTVMAAIEEAVAASRRTRPKVVSDAAA